MAKITASNEISKKLISLHSKHGYRSEQYLVWAIDDYLADLTGQPKKEPPPKEVMPELFELGQLYAQAVIAAPPFTDVLGKTYMDLVSTGGQKMLGQYFTPEPIARLMAGLTAPDITDINKAALFKLYEPTCGSGVMVLQFMRCLVENHGAAVLEKISVTGIDLESVCAKMFAAQMLANGLIHGFSYGELLVLQGNSLGDPAKLNVIVHASHVKFEGKLPPAKHPVRIEAIKEAAKGVIKHKEGQLTLF